ncbi:MAG: hypothetical protein J6O49_21055 [Bacteroidaceae bacterium]|nr:hypothetical protein [Bacteroidaceae bacterium]
MATVLTLRIMDNGDQLKAETATVDDGDFLAVHYFKNDVFTLAHTYHKSESLIKVFDDIGKYMALIV